MALRFRDFLPRVRRPATKGFLGLGSSPPEFDSFASAVTAAGAWLAESGIKPTQFETVVLPDMHDPGENGSIDPELVTSSEMNTSWYQFLRVWYMD